MNRKILVLVCLMLSLIALPINAQDRFRVDYNRMSIYNPRTGQWSETEIANHTFVLNINDNNDIMHYKANGSRVTYRNVTKIVEKGKTSDGIGYQLLILLDENGEEFQFRIFDDLSIGVTFTYKNGTTVQFANADNKHNTIDLTDPYSVAKLIDNALQKQDFEMLMPLQTLINDQFARFISRRQSILETFELFKGQNMRLLKVENRKIDNDYRVDGVRVNGAIELYYINDRTNNTYCITMHYAIWNLLSFGGDENSILWMSIQNSISN